MDSHSDDAPVKITFRDYQPRGESDLELWLRKEAAVGSDSKSDKTKLDDNEADTTVRTVDMYDPPEGRDGTSNYAKSGEPPNMLDEGRHDPFHNHDATYDSSVEVRQGVLERLFDSTPAARKADQELLSQNFEHARTGDFTAHSALLQSKTKEGSALPHVARRLTLSERVKKVLG